MLLYRALLIVFARLAVFRAGPQDIPAHAHSLGVGLLANVLASGVLQLITPSSEFVWRVLVYLSLTLLAAKLYLHVRGVTERWQQTVAALLGADAVVSIAAIPLLLWGESVSRAGETMGPDYGLLILAWILWSATVAANIYRHALNVSWPAAIGISYATTLIGIVVSIFLFDSE